MTDPIVDVVVLREQLADVRAAYDQAATRVTPGVSRVLETTDAGVFDQIGDLYDDLDELDTQVRILTATLTEYRAALSRMLNLVSGS